MKIEQLRFGALRFPLAQVTLQGESILLLMF